MSLPAYSRMKSSRLEWLTDIPHDWGETNLRWVSSMFSGGTPDKSNLDYWTNGDIPWLSSGEVNQFRVSTATTYITSEGLQNSSTKWIPKGALLMALAGQGKTKGMVAELLFDATCNQSMAAIIPTDRVHSGYLLWWLTSNYENIRNMAGGDLRDGLNLRLLGDIGLPLPSRVEQAAISTFLDHETAAIDELVEAQRELIALLKEKRQAVISHAVTKGLDPDAPMKPSGIDWLGDVPAHWETTRLKSVCSEIVDCKNRTPPEVPEGGYFVIRTSCLGNGDFDPNGGYWTDEASFVEWTRKGTPRQGDILISREAPIGEACLFPDGYPLCLGQRMMFLRPDPSQADPNFLLSAIYSSYGRRYVDLRRKGSTVGHLRVSEIDNYPFIAPPIEEQKKIAAFLTHGTTQIDKLIAEAHSAISLIRERRAALISAAVTGKIDVRGLVDLPETEKVLA